MAEYRAFGATNEPRTCLWCGRRLRPKWHQEWQIGSLEPDPATRRLVGYGDYGDGFFCGLRCGYQFGVDMAKNGRRFQAVTSG